MIDMRLAEVPARGTTAPAYSAAAEWNGTTHSVTSRSEPACKLARLLVALGCPDQPWKASQGGTVVWRGRSLLGWAGMAVTEGDRMAPKFVKFVPMPEGLHQRAKHAPNPSDVACWAASDGGAGNLPAAGG